MMVAVLALACAPACFERDPRGPLTGDDGPPDYIGDAGCGGYTGSGDQVFERAPGDTLIECDNGGYVVNLASGSLEGHLVDGVGIDPATSGIEFTPTTNADGTMSTPELGGGAWTAIHLDAVGLDHADAMCQALTTRSWWAQPTTVVPAIVEFADPTSPLAPATHRLVLCPNASAYVMEWFGYNAATYELDAGQVTLQLEPAGSGPAPMGALHANGQLFTPDEQEPGVSAAVWPTTTAEAAADATFCATGVFPTM